jgi:hypothetical protein
MTLTEFAVKIHAQIAREFIVKEKENCFAIQVPFMFPDGDHFVIVMRQNSRKEWEFSDKGHTLMHLSFDGSDEKLFSDENYGEFCTTLKNHGMENRDGVLVRKATEEYF